MKIEGKRIFFVGIFIMLITIGFMGMGQSKENFFKASLNKTYSFENSNKTQEKFANDSTELKVIVEFSDEKYSKRTNLEISKLTKIDSKKIGKTLLKNKKIMIVNLSGYELLVNNPSIKKVSISKQYKIDLQDSVPLINATSLWQKQISGINFTGSGQSICIIDTGVNYSHGDLGGCYGNNSISSNCKVIGGWDFCADDNNCLTEDWNPMDVQGHGTHVAGIAGANGSIRGVAPDAKIVMIKASNGTGTFWDQEIILGIEWCVNHAPEFNISVISMSLGGDLSEEYCPGDPLEESINLAIANGISVVAASGNDYTSDAISSPGCIQNATPVTSSPKSDNSISLFANTWNDSSLMIIDAPGENINSTIKTGRYESWDGTSMATPHVAGTIAIINQYMRLKGQTRTPQQIENLLNETGKQIYDSYSKRTFSRIDVYSAIRSLCSDNITNTSWQNLGNVTPCMANNTILYNFSKIEYDANNCGFTNNRTYYLTNESVCDFCSPSLTNISTAWINITPINNDKMNQTRNTTQYDANNCDEISNETFVEYRATLFADFCLPHWTAVEENNLIWYNDSNNCYSQTNLSSDLENKPLNITLQINENKTEFFDNESNNSLILEMNFNYSVSNNSLASLDILKQNLSSNFSYTIITGINLTENTSWTKTVYIDKLLKSDLYCIIDSENVALSNFSVYCNSTSEEKLLKCPGNKENYSCTENGTKFKIIGLRHSAIRELEQFCGDGIKNESLSEECDDGNTASGDGCSSACKTESSGNNGGGSSGGGGGGGISPKTYSINEQNLSIGSSQKIYPGDKINFIISGINHTMELKNIIGDKANLLIRSEPINISLKISEETKLNLTSKNYFDLYIKLENISFGKANLTIKKIFETRPEFAQIDKGNEYHITNETNKTGSINNLPQNLSIKYQIETIIILLIFAIIYYLVFRKHKMRKRKFK